MVVYSYYHIFIHCCSWCQEPCGNVLVLTVGGYSVVEGTFHVQIRTISILHIIFMIFNLRADQTEIWGLVEMGKHDLECKSGPHFCHSCSIRRWFFIASVCMGYRINLGISVSSGCRITLQQNKWTFLLSWNINSFLYLLISDIQIIQIKLILISNIVIEDSKYNKSLTNTKATRQSCATKHTIYKLLGDTLRL